MASSSSLSTFILSSSLLLLSLSLLRVINGDGQIINIIPETCQKLTPRVPFQYCTRSLQTIPMEKTSDLESLGFASIATSLDKATKIKNTIQTLLQDGAQMQATPNLKNALASCLVKYDTTIADLENVIQQYDGKEYSEVVLILGSNVGERHCQTDLNEMNVQIKNPLGKLERDFQRYLRIPSGIVHLLPIQE